MLLRVAFIKFLVSFILFIFLFSYSSVAVVFFDYSFKFYTIIKCIIAKCCVVCVGLVAGCYCCLYWNTWVTNTNIKFVGYRSLTINKIHKKNILKNTEKKTFVMFNMGFSYCRYWWCINCGGDSMGFDVCLQLNKTRILLNNTVRSAEINRI